MQGGGKAAAWPIVVLLLAAFTWGGWQILSAPLKTGEVYPPYSSLRADPLGAEAIYDSLASLNELTVSRLYKKGLPLHSGATLMVLGVDPYSVAEAPKETFEGYETLAQSGGRVVIGLLPAYAPLKISSQTARKAPKPEEIEAIGERWDIRFRFSSSPQNDGQSGDIPRDTALYFDPGPEWHVISANDGRPVVTERDWGRGTLVLVSDSYPLSNQGLAERNESSRIVGIIGPARQVIFDESHLGVLETGSVSQLMEKYRLEGAVAMLFILAGLFLWRAGSSFLPPRRPGRPSSISGRDSREGLAALLRRSVPERQLLEACIAEWKGMKPLEFEVRRLERAMVQSSGRGPVEQYRAASAAVTERRP